MLLHREGSLHITHECLSKSQQGICLLLRPRAGTSFHIALEPYWGLRKRPSSIAHDSVDVTLCHLRGRFTIAPLAAAVSPSPYFHRQWCLPVPRELLPDAAAPIWAGTLEIEQAPLNGPRATPLLPLVGNARMHELRGRMSAHAATIACPFAICERSQWGPQLTATGQSLSRCDGLRSLFRLSPAPPRLSPPVTAGRVIRCCEGRCPLHSPPLSAPPLAGTARCVSSKCERERYGDAHAHSHWGATCLSLPLALCLSTAYVLCSRLLDSSALHPQRKRKRGGRDQKEMERGDMPGHLTGSFCLISTAGPRFAVHELVNYGWGAAPRRSVSRLAKGQEMEASKSGNSVFRNDDLDSRFLPPTTFVPSLRSFSSPLAGISSAARRTLTVTPSDTVHQATPAPCCSLENLDGVIVRRMSPERILVRVLAYSMRFGTSTPPTGYLPPAFNALRGRGIRTMVTGLRTFVCTRTQSCPSSPPVVGAPALGPDSLCRSGRWANLVSLSASTTSDAPAAAASDLTLGVGNDCSAAEQAHTRTVCWDFRQCCSCRPLRCACDSSALLCPRQEQGSGGHHMPSMVQIGRPASLLVRCTLHAAFAPLEQALASLRLASGIETTRTTRRCSNRAHFCPSRKSGGCLAATPPGPRDRVARGWTSSPRDYVAYDIFYRCRRYEVGATCNLRLSHNINDREYIADNFY
ncbi:hypothetical protein K438DRAFT_1767016 [Mycena galopus ATCC 62051]|nr:hypothetical protein K438DRAFT_1767016 [Mycena galopus ATCC 62051]